MTEQEEFLSTLVWVGSSSPSEPQSDSGSEPVLKVCTRCNEEQPLDNFHKDTTKPGGLRYWCKICISKKNASYHKKRRVDLEDTSMEADDTTDALYVMSNSLLPGMIKIGRSTNPEERAKQLGASHPFRIKVELSYGGKGFLEKTLHDRLKHRRVEGGLGREWFRLTAEQADVLIRASIVDNELANH